MCAAKSDIHKNIKISVATATMSVPGPFEGFLKLPCNYLFSKMIQISAGKMNSRYLNTGQKQKKCYFAATRVE